MWVGLGNDRSQVQLDGFKTRAIQASASEQRHLYVTAWHTLNTKDSSSSLRQSEVLVLQQTGAVHSRHTPTASLAVGTWSAVVMATAVQHGRLNLQALSALEIALTLIQVQATEESPLTMCLLTSGAQLPLGGLLGAHQAGPLGLARSVRTETQLPLAHIDATTTLALKSLATVTELEAAVRGKRYLVSRLAAAPGITTSSASLIPWMYCAF